MSGQCAWTLDMRSISCAFKLQNYHCDSGAKYPNSLKRIFSLHKNYTIKMFVKDYVNQLPFTCSNSMMETPEQSVKSVQS